MRQLSHADTLTAFLGILTHPSELGLTTDSKTTHAANIETSLTVVFILDRFELFTKQPKQLLLYNLFDIAQAKRAPVAVIGLTRQLVCIIIIIYNIIF